MKEGVPGGGEGILDFNFTRHFGAKKKEAKMIPEQQHIPVGASGKYTKCPLGTPNCGRCRSHVVRGRKLTRQL